MNERRRRAMQVAIDGPCGVGKTWTAKALAERLNFQYIDTGSIYRAVALQCRERGIEKQDIIKEDLEQFAIRLIPGDGIYAMGERIPDGSLRNEIISGMASDISTRAVVREYVLNIEREAAESCDVVMEGRDIGEHVLPMAQAKFYLTASHMARAARRYAQRPEDYASLAAAYYDIAIRDDRDMNRKNQPLRRTPEHIVIDSTLLDPVTTLDIMERVARAKLGLSDTITPGQDGNRNAAPALRRVPGVPVPVGKFSGRLHIMAAVKIHGHDNKMKLNFTIPFDEDMDAHDIHRATACRIIELDESILPRDAVVESIEYIAPGKGNGGAG